MPNIFGIFSLWGRSEVESMELEKIGKEKVCTGEAGLGTAPGWDTASRMDPTSV